MTSGYIERRKGDPPRAGDEEEPWWEGEFAEGLPIKRKSRPPPLITLLVSAQRQSLFCRRRYDIFISFFPRDRSTDRPTRNYCAFGVPP